MTLQHRPRRFASARMAAAAAVVLAGAGAAGPAAAQATEEGAEALRLDIKRFLASQFLQLPEMTSRITLDGGIEVVPAGNRYDLTIPPATVMIEPKWEDAITASMGAITGTATPRDNGWLDLSLDLPGRIEVMPMESGIGEEPQVSGSERVVATLGERMAELTVVPELGAVIAADLRVADLRVAPETEEGSITIGMIRALQTADERSDGALDLVYDAAIENAAFTEGDTELARFGRLGFAGSAVGIRLDAVMAFSEEMNALATRLEGQEPTAEDFQALSATLDQLPLLFESVDGRYVLENLHVDAEGMLVDIAEARLGAGIGGLAGEATTVLFDIGMRDLTVDPPPPMTEGFMPRTVGLSVRFADLPNEALMQAMDQFLTSAAQMGPEMAMMMGLGALQGALTSGDAAIVVDELSFDTPRAGVTGNARVEPSTESMLGVVATANLAVAGIDAIIAATRDLPDGKSIASVLTLVQAMGRDGEPDAEGRPVKTFEIELTPSGQALMNGTDMGPLMEGLQ